ncbi:MAG: NAD(P)-dependent oxidoreductase [Candidatus Liptonbacteria bacterium]|nr:NAD(P)-dependent oxidoreductase [Candidatus Liptonbacteria bacterium]
MRVFVTGGTGFIGRYTIQELKKRGHRLLVLSRKNHQERGIDFIKGDLSDIAKWKGRLKKFKPHVAVHLAWEGIPDFSYAQSVKNLEGSLNIFSALADIGCKKIVAAGSSFEYGKSIGKLNEEMSITPVTAFTAAKHALHLMGEELAKERNMDFIWLRPFNPYGYGQRTGSLIPYIMRTVLGNVPLRLKYPLAQGDFIYVSDVARAFADAALRGKGRATYNLGSGHLTPVRDIAEMVCKEMGASREYYNAFFRTSRGKLQNAAYAGLKNIRRDLGWRPLVDIKTGIKKTIRDYESR